MESVLTTPRAGSEAELAGAIEDLRRRLLADPPPPVEDVRRALDAIAAMALALYGPTLAEASETDGRAES